jgi:molecular chaperone GrpE
MSNEQNETNADTPQVEQVETATSEVDTLNAMIAKLTEENEELRNQSLRALADYKNFKRRTEQERAELIRNASAGLLLKLLPVIDDIERAGANVPTEISESSWYTGYQLITQKLQTLLSSEGVSAIPAVGEPFDPNVHEAVIFEEAGEGGDNVVLAELQKGYKLNDRVLRPTMVKVGKA